MKKRSKTPVEPPSQPAEPILAHRKMNRNSTIKSGRTIAEKREHLETANERFVARKKDKKKKNFRIFFTSLCFMTLGLALAFFVYNLINAKPSDKIVTTNGNCAPTIEIIDEDASVTDGKITNRMTSFIGQAEQDFRDLGYTPTKAVIPTNTVREVDFYLEGHNGYVKTTIDRGSAVSVEDADRLIRYLGAQGINDFTYIDVRIEHRAYWR